MCIKNEIDSYMVKNYKQLNSTTTKIIKKRKRHLDATTVISHTYLYLLKNQQQILDFSNLHGKTVEHIIYSFTLKYINSAIYWENSDINKENSRLSNKTINIELFNETSDSSIFQQDEIYTEDFIQAFYQTLNKLDGICFYAYYYAGFNKAKDFAEHFDISISSSYNSIHHLKSLFTDFINKNKIY